MTNGIEVVKHVPRLQSVASATGTLASRSRRAGAYAEPVLNSATGTSTCGDVGVAEGEHVLVGQVRAVVGAGGALRRGQLGTGPGSQLVGVHVDGQPPRGSRAEHGTARHWSASKAPCSQKASTPVASGAQTSVIGPATSST